MEVFGYLLFLGAFGLGYGFGKNELLGLMDCVCWRKEAEDLFRALGLVDMMPKFIQNLIDKKQHLEAIRYIYAFELVDKFRPVPVLKSYLEHSKKIAEGIRQKGNSCHGSEITSLNLNTRLRALKSALPS